MGQMSMQGSHQWCTGEVMNELWIGPCWVPTKKDKEFCVDCCSWQGQAPGQVIGTGAVEHALEMTASKRLAQARLRMLWI
ncbi:hypothetical protein N9L68_06310 [bacterium]|nr:hypothetical protein [bacterium]